MDGPEIPFFDPGVAAALAQNERVLAGADFIRRRL